MNHPFFIWVIIHTVTIFLTLPAAQADTGSSHNLFVLNRIDQNAFFVSRSNLATRQGISDTFFGYADINYRYSIDQNWSLEAGYRHAVLELSNGWREEYRPMFALYWKSKLSEGTFSNRSRIELRYFEGNAKDRLRYRNESVWNARNTITAYQLTPFVEEELFYDITDSEFNTNWLTFGVSKFWTKGIKWKLGYRLQSQKFTGEWESRHILVTGISFLMTE